MKFTLTLLMWRALTMLYIRTEGHSLPVRMTLMLKADTVIVSEQMSVALCHTAT